MAKVNSFNLYYAVGQSAMIGQISFGKTSLIHGYLNPISNFSNKTKIPVEWSVYPNPFYDQFIIQFPFDIDSAKIHLYDLKGMQVSGKITKKSSSSFQISQLGHLATTTYLLLIEHQGVLYQRHIVHEN